MSPGTGKPVHFVRAASFNRPSPEAVDAGLGDRIAVSFRGIVTELVGVAIAKSSLPASEQNKAQDYGFLSCSDAVFNC